MKKIANFTSRFGFHVDPFTCEIRVEEHFRHEVFNQALGYLVSAVQKRMCAALIAPAGTGKSALLRALNAKLPETRYRVRYVKVTDLSKRDLCREIALAVGCDPANNYPTLVRRLQDHFLISFDVDGLRPVLFLDESHDIRPEVLGMIRILTNFEMDSRLVVSIILAGQPPLAKMLQHPRLEDVTRRLDYCGGLRLLSRQECFQYVNHRCRIAGCSDPPFDDSSRESLYEMTRGNLRAIDHLALKSLELAHIENCEIVDSNHVVEARNLLWPQ